MWNRKKKVTIFRKGNQLKCFYCEFLKNNFWAYRNGRPSRNYLNDI